jgi:hypothetical protein
VQTVETAADGSQVVTESVKVTRKTSTQNWPAYNAAQCSEKATVPDRSCAAVRWHHDPGASGPGSEADPASAIKPGTGLELCKSSVSPT